MSNFRYRHDPVEDIDIVESDGLSLVVRRRGAEAIGLTRHHPSMGDIGLLWRNGLTDGNTPFWKSHAPILFPIVGGIHGNRSRTSQGEEVGFPGLHGFVRCLSLDMLEATARGDEFRLSYRLESDEETLAMYPWDFALAITYELGRNHLGIAMEVTNTGSRALPFQIGWHPGFALPFRSGVGTKAACHVRLPGRLMTMLENDDECHLTGVRRQIDGRGDFQFTEDGLDRTYMLDLEDVPAVERVVTLLDPDEAFGVRVSFPDLPHLGLWSDAGAPFLCIEPWQGMDDSVIQEPFDRKFGMVNLAPGCRDLRSARIDVLS
jgi:galactose mutarotase-like enzyme